MIQTRAYEKSLPSSRTNLACIIYIASLLHVYCDIIMIFCISINHLYTKIISHFSISNFSITSNYFYRKEVGTEISLFVKYNRNLINNTTFLRTIFSVSRIENKVTDFF